MVKKGQPYTSGNWLVKVESEESFIDRWTAFTECPLKNAPGAETFILIQDSDDPRRFVSFGAWDNPEAVTAWRQRPEFRELLGECRALCEEFEPHDSTLAASSRAGRRADRELPGSASPLRNSLMPFLILMQTSSVSFSGVLKLVRITNRAGTDFSTASPSLGSSMNRP